jgi:hypothetical protein
MEDLVANNFLIDHNTAMVMESIFLLGLSKRFYFIVALLVATIGQL